MKQLRTLTGETLNIHPLTTTQSITDMKTVFNNTAVCVAFVAQGQPTGRNSTGSIYFEGDTIYSYGYHFPMCRIVGNVALITIRGYSPTTSSHMSDLRSALRGSDLQVIEVYDVKADSEAQHILNSDDLLERADAKLKTASRARKYKQMHLDDATELRHNELVYRKWYTDLLMRRSWEKRAA